MSTSDKIKAIRHFLSGRKNKLMWSKGERIQASVYFDIELSETKKEIDFSICIESSNIEEAVSILGEVTKNKDLKNIRTEVESKLESAFIDPNDKFFLIVKGNKDERIKTSDIE